LDRELQDYYENRFTTMATTGWQDFIDDVKAIFDTYNQISSTDNYDEFLKRKGQLDTLQWVLSLKDVSTQAFEELQLEETI
jgi:hypothetical protein